MLSHLHFCEFVYCIPPIRAKGCAFRSFLPSGFNVWGAIFAETKLGEGMLIYGYIVLKFVYRCKKS